MVEPAARVLLPFRTVFDRLRHTLQPSEGLHVVRDADEWARHWAGPSSGTPAPAAVDWQTEMCVVVGLGTRPSTGYLVLIGAIVVFGDEMTVQAWEIRPGHNCAVMRMVTHPFHVVAVPAHAGTVRLTKHIAYQDCEATDR
ncbi:protease complex subunit PrcB family protein [Actinoplanes sp. NPDC051861]|uniref:protease complex subunit PrcB family protein n=1 Tax=Actinoplanes sp. NPDC051861 TaxID=3155170 RepID=UPI00342CCD90